MTRRLKELLEQAKKRGGCLIHGLGGYLYDCRTLDEALQMITSADAAWAYLVMDVPPRLQARLLRIAGAEGASDTLHWLYGGEGRGWQTPVERRHQLIAQVAPEEARILISDVEDLAWIYKVPRGDLRLLRLLAKAARNEK